MTTVIIIGGYVVGMILTSAFIYACEDHPITSGDFVAVVIAGMIWPAFVILLAIIIIGKSLQPIFERRG